MIPQFRPHSRCRLPHCSAALPAALALLLLTSGCRQTTPSPNPTLPIATTAVPTPPNPTVPELLAQLAGPSPFHNAMNLSGAESELSARMQNLHYQPRATDEPALLAALRDPAQPLTTQLCLAGYLLQLHNTAARQFLLTHLDSNEPLSIQESAHAILFHIKKDVPDDWGLAQIIRVIASDHLLAARGNWAVYEQIAQLKLTALEPTLIAALMRNPGFGSLARAVAAFDDPRATAALAATLESPRGSIAEMQASLLHQRHYPGLAPILARHLDDQSGVIADILCYMDDKSVLPALRDYVAQHPQTENAKYLSIAIIRLESADQKDLVVRICRLLDQSQDSAVCSRAIGILEDIRDPAAIPAILRLLQRSTDPGNLMDAIFFLQDVPGPQATRALVTLLDRKFTDDSTHKGQPSSFSLHEWTVRALEKITTEKFGNNDQKWRDYAARLPEN